MKIATESKRIKDFIRDICDYNNLSNTNILVTYHSHYNDLTFAIHLPNEGDIKEIIVNTQGVKFIVSDSISKIDYMKKIDGILKKLKEFK